MTNYYSFKSYKADKRLIANCVILILINQFYGCLVLPGFYQIILSPASVEMKIFNELKRFNGDRKGMEKKFYQKLNVKRESVGIK